MQTSIDTDDAAVLNPERLMSSPGYGSGICCLSCMLACKAKKSQTRGQKAKSSSLGV